MSVYIWLLLISLNFGFSKPQPPTKYVDQELTIQANNPFRFANQAIESGEFVKLKKSEWRACKQSHQEKQAWAPAQITLVKFLEAPVEVSNLYEIEKKNLMKSELSEYPWSGDYWPIASGVLASRFQDPEFRENYGWLARYEYAQKKPMMLMLQTQGQEALQTLSPAEKYDLLIGQIDGPFTQSQWEQGKKYHDEDGIVEGWMGICHGWAPAAIMEPRPRKSVDLLSFDSQWKIHFNPDEVKGLLSYSWATNSFPTVSVGERCYKENPERDENGRLTDPECFDMNPAVWHLAVIHKIGLQKRSFVMDATYDYEVWNQPVIGYSYSYFNPITEETTDDLEKASVLKTEFSNDRFAKYRSGRTQKIVGIKMKVGYINETGASDSETDSPDNDSVRWVLYAYDLEIDNKNQIIGGEWHLEGHPDFIWSPKKNSKAMSSLDIGLLNYPWKVGEPLPAPWAAAAEIGAPRGILLNTISEAIVKKSH